MQALAHANTFEALSGCSAEVEDIHHEATKTELMNPLRQAWGREKNYHSLLASDKLVADMNSNKYDLPARLQQTFDFLTFKVYQSAFRGNEMEADSRQRTVFTYLL